MDTVLELRALSKHYPAHPAVNDISLSIGQGEFFSLLGPSGCGKTTTLRMIAGFETPTSGEILLDGQSVAPARALLPELIRNNPVLYPDSGGTSTWRVVQSSAWAGTTLA